MKTTVTFSDFVDAFRHAGRQGTFSYDGLRALFDHLEGIERDTGEEIELDPIAICCDYDEDTVASIADQYDIDLSDCEDEEDKEEAVRSYLEDHTEVVATLSNGVIVYRLF